TTPRRAARRSRAMTPFFLADVGNSRIKVGRCDRETVLDAAALVDDDALPFDVPAGAEWAVAGVHPERRDRFVARLREHGQIVRVVTDYRELPIRVDVVPPQGVGLDRLLNAVG